MLTDIEQKLVYHVEVLGMKANRAGDILGISNPYSVLARPHVQDAVQKTRETIQGKLNITREDIARGYLSAIEDAKTLADPMAQIAGWRELSKLLGFDQPLKVEHTLASTAAERKRMVQQKTDADLLALAGPDVAGVIDADFYVLDSQH